MKTQIFNVQTTISDNLVYAHDQLKATSDAPALDAERLLTHVLEKSEISWLYAHPEQKLTERQRLHFKKLVAERTTGKPLAYILGSWEFYGREFLITEDVLVPRPSTENLVDAALQYIKTSILRHMEGKTGPTVIADIGTGGGCIIISLVLELAMNQKLGIRNYAFIATDISGKALDVAKKNAKIHGVEDKIEFLQGDMLEPIRQFESAHCRHAQGRPLNVDLIVSNPPYLPAVELNSVHKVCRPGPHRVQGELETAGLKFEPRIALEGGKDGTQFVNIILASNISAIVETTDGKIISNVEKEKPSVVHTEGRI